MPLEIDATRSPAAMPLAKRRSMSAGVLAVLALLLIHGDVAIAELPVSFVNDVVPVLTN